MIKKPKIPLDMLAILLFEDKIIMPKIFSFEETRKLVIEAYNLGQKNNNENTTNNTDDKKIDGVSLPTVFYTM